MLVGPASLPLQLRANASLPKRVVQAGGCLGRLLHNIGGRDAGKREWEGSSRADAHCLLAPCVWACVELAFCEVLPGLPFMLGEVAETAAMLAGPPAAVAQAPAGMQQAIEQALPPLLAPIQQELEQVQQMLQTLVHRTSPELQHALLHNSRAQLHADALLPVPHPDTGAQPPFFPGTNSGELQAAGASRCHAALALPPVMARGPPPPPSSMRALAAAVPTGVPLPRPGWGLAHHIYMVHPLPLPLSTLHPSAELAELTHAQLGTLLAFYGQPVAGNRQERMGRLKAVIGQP